MKIEIAGSLLLIAVGVACLAGWGMNVVSLVKLDFAAPYKAEAIRSIGVFVPPVGVIAGYITFAEEEK